jgi:hypothetical protein
MRIVSKKGSAGGETVETREPSRRVAEHNRQGVRGKGEVEVETSSLEANLARALFREQLHAEAARISEDRFDSHVSIDHVYTVMWNETKVDVRRNCEERAKSLADFYRKANYR